MPKPRNYCAVDGCKSQKTNDLSFFSLPRDEERRRTWLEIIGRPDLLTTQTKSACHFVCSLHFDKSMIKYVPQLKPDAVPTKSHGPVKIYTKKKTLDEDPEESEEESHFQGSQVQEPPNVFAFKSTGLTPMTPMTRKRKLLTHTYSPIKESQEKTLDEDPEESEEESHFQGSQEQEPPNVFAFKSEPNDQDNLIEPIENEFDLFCKSLAIQLKKISLDRALICQEKLQSVMTQERLAQVEHAAPLIKLENQYDSDSSS